VSDNKPWTLDDVEIGETVIYHGPMGPTPVQYRGRVGDHAVVMFGLMQAQVHVDGIAPVVAEVSK
jgi:hypothetical protein